MTKPSIFEKLNVEGFFISNDRPLLSIDGRRHSVKKAIVEACFYIKAQMGITWFFCEISIRSYMHLCHYLEVPISYSKMRLDDGTEIAGTCLSTPSGIVFITPSDLVSHHMAYFKDSAEPSKTICEVTFNV